MEFLYKAYADSGEVEEGRVAAAGKREAVDELKSRGLHPMTIRKREKRKKSPFSKDAVSPIWLKNGNHFFPRDSRNRNFRHPWRRPERERKDSSGRDQGDHRSRALHCGKFCGIPCVSAFFTALLQVGELSGTIPEQLRLAAACYRKEEEFIAGMKSALSYPVFVLFFSFLVFALILTVILPSFAALLTPSTYRFRR